MKKLIALCSLPASLLAFVIACDTGGSAVTCETDEDCAEGEACLPTSDVDETLICQTSECEENADCQVGFNNQEGTLAANPSCEAATDCEEGETCALGFGGAGFCVVDGGCPPGLTGAVTLNVELAGGGMGDVCVDEASQCTSGACEA